MSKYRFARQFMFFVVGFSFMAIIACAPQPQWNSISKEYLILDDKINDQGIKDITAIATSCIIDNNYSILLVNSDVGLIMTDWLVTSPNFSGQVRTKLTVSILKEARKIKVVSSEEIMITIMQEYPRWEKAHGSLGKGWQDAFMLMIEPVISCLDERLRPYHVSIEYEPSSIVGRFAVK